MRGPGKSIFQPPHMEPADVAFREWFDARRRELLHLTRRIVESGEEHVPLLFAFSPKNEVAIKQLDYSGRTPEEHQRKKNLAMAYVRVIAMSGADRVRGVITVQEAWDATVPASAGIPREGIANLEGRGEIIMYNAFARKGDGIMQLMACHRITRNPNALAEEAFRIDDPYSSGNTGRMVGGDTGTRQ